MSMGEEELDRESMLYCKRDFYKIFQTPIWVRGSEEKPLLIIKNLRLNLKHIAWETPADKSDV